MLSMAKINDIKYFKQVQGLSYRKVKTLTGHSYTTVTDIIDCKISPENPANFRERRMLDFF